MREFMKNNKDYRRLLARVSVVDQKCDLILAQLKSLRVSNDIDELIDRLHRQARAMRKDLRR